MGRKAGSRGRRGDAPGREFDDDSLVELDPDEALEFLSRTDEDPEAAPGDGSGGASGISTAQVEPAPPGAPDGSEVDEEAIARLEAARAAALDDDSHDGSDVREAVEAARKAYESSESVELEPDAPEIPGYVIEGVIGRGATGVVYRARQLAVERSVALKVMHRELITNRRAVRRLKREARLAAKLAHPSIISAIDMGSIDGLWWYAMELVEGIPLSRRIAERQQLSERECLRLFSPLCDALQHAHEVGVVHRDIKPANILLDHRGRARLVDLGLAMGSNDPSITKTGATLGTPHYVSPEQARDPSAADIRSDIWSVGATIYHAVCGHPPFHSTEDDEGGVAEILSRVLYEPIVDPREYAPNVSRGFALMLRKCLTRDPSKRYQEPWEIVADIELLRERRRLDVSTGGLDAYATRRPQWVRPFALTFGLVGLVVATWAFTARPWEPRREPQVVERSAGLDEWPELREIQRGLDDGTMSLAEALAELDSPTVRAIDPSMAYLKNELVVDVKRRLEERVERFVSNTTGDVEAALEERRFDEATRALGAGFDEGLRADTGFVDLAELPAGKVRRNSLNWLRRERERVDRAREDAVRIAGIDLSDAYPAVVETKVADLLADNRWRDALEWLEPDDPSEWRRRFSSVVLDGLSAEERDLVFGTIEARLSSDRSVIRGRMLEVIEESRDFQSSELDRWLEAIDADEVPGESTAAESFALAVAVKHKAIGLDLEQLPPIEARRHRQFSDDVRAAIELRSRERRLEVARTALVLLIEDVDRLCVVRNYPAATELLAVARREEWRESTFDALDRRLREVELLQSVLDRAAARVEAAHRSEREFRLSWGPVRGRIDARSGDVLRRGFRFRTNVGQIDELHMLLSRPLAVALEATQLDEAHVVDVHDVLALAGLANRNLVSPEEELAAAAFLLCEGKPREARDWLRLENHDLGGGLPSDLEGRARREVDRRSRVADSTSEGAAPTKGAAKTVATLVEAFGTPNQTEVRSRVHLVWRFAEDGDEPDGLLTPLPFGDDRVGAWSAKDWGLSSYGFGMLDSRADRGDVLRDGSGPTLPLAEPIDRDAPLDVTIEVVPGDSRPLPHLFVLSVRGYHVVIHGELVWFGTGSLRELYTYVDQGGTDDFDGYRVGRCESLQDGVAVEIELSVKRKKLVKLRVGRVLVDNLGSMYDEPEYDDPYIRIRSRGPMHLREAQLEARRATH